MYTEITEDRAAGLQTQVQMIQAEIDICREAGLDSTHVDSFQILLKRMANGDKNISDGERGHLYSILCDDDQNYLYAILDQEEEQGHPITYYKFGNKHFADIPSIVELLESIYCPDGDQKDALEFFRNLEEERSVH